MEGRGNRQFYNNLGINHRGDGQFDVTLGEYVSFSLYSVTLCYTRREMILNSTTYHKVFLKVGENVLKSGYHNRYSGHEWERVNTVSSIAPCR